MAATQVESRKHRGRLYRVWESMRSRCNRPTCRDYPEYGGRGISVCGEWSCFSAFRNWSLANGYCAGSTIDRKNNDGPYSQENCRWTTRSRQSQNRRKLGLYASAFKGVFAQREKWFARITIEYQVRHLGTFESEVDAARAYDAAALELFGPDAKLNFPKEETHAG